MVGTCRIVLLTALLSALTAFAQSGLRLPERAGSGLDPSFARGWLAPEYDRFGFAGYHWRDAYGFAPAPRMQWSYAFSERGSLSMSLASGRDALRESEFEQRPLSIFGRYWFSPDWALSAESLSRDPGGLLRLQDFRIGVQRRF
jgi:hypothetical protein